MYNRFNVDKKFGLKSGTTILLPAKFDCISPVVNNTIIYVDSHKYGILFTDTLVNVPVVFDEVRVSNTDLNLVRLDQSWYYIDHLGNIYGEGYTHAFHESDGTFEIYIYPDWIKITRSQLFDHQVDPKRLFKV